LGKLANLAQGSKDDGAFSIDPWYHHEVLAVGQGVELAG
jgi:hypothetical protein